jgi:hypothetical protein
MDEILQEARSRHDEDRVDAALVGLALSKQAKANERIESGSVSLTQTWQ